MEAICVCVVISAVCCVARRRYQTRLIEFNKAPTEMRVTFGLVFVPAFRWAINEVIDVSVCIAFTTMPMMPFSTRFDLSRHINPYDHQDIDGLTAWINAGAVSFVLDFVAPLFSALPETTWHRFVFVYLWSVCGGALIAEVGQLRDFVFKGIDLPELWSSAFALTLQVGRALLWWARVRV